MDNLIELIIFLVVIWQISATLKKVFKPNSKKKPGGANASPGWQDKLREVAEKIKEEIEAQNARANAPSGEGWEKVAPEKNKKAPTMAERQKKPPELPSKRKPPVKDRDENRIKAMKKQLDSPYDQRDTAEKNGREERGWIPENIGEPPERMHLKQEKRRKRHRPLQQFKGLKKAIVWKEILDTPPGLREDMGGSSRSKFSDNE